MDKSIEAMKLALEALEGFYEYGYDRQECFEHITAIKEALAEHAMREVQRLGQEIEQKIGCVNHDCDQCKAQPEQEPAACKTLCELCVKRGYTFCANAVKTTHIYTAPPQRKPLTKEEMFEAIRPLYSSEMSARIAVDYSEDEYRAIEAAHGIKGDA